MGYMLFKDTTMKTQTKRNSIIESFQVSIDDNGLSADVVYNDTNSVVDLDDVEKLARRMIIRDGFDVSLLTSMMLTASSDKAAA